MSIDTTLLTANFNLMYESIHPLECVIEEQDGILRCGLTWLEAKARKNFLERLVRGTKGTLYCGKIIWFQEGDSYTKSKPFKILWTGLEHPCDEKEAITIILVVSGKKTDRIEKKWTAKLSVFFGYQVSIIWEEDAQ